MASALSTQDRYYNCQSALTITP